MNRYVLAGIALMCLGAQASENPFDLKQNLQNLDADQSALLSDLQKSAKDDEFLEDEPVKEESKESDEQSVIVPTSEENLTQTAVQADEQAEVINTVPTEVNTTVPTEVKSAVEMPSQTEAKEETKTEHQPDSNTTDNQSQEANATDTMQEYEKLLKENKTDMQEEQGNKPVEVPTAEGKPVVIQKEIVVSKQGDINLSKEEIERLYLEAIKEVEGK